MARTDPTRHPGNRIRHRPLSCRLQLNTIEDGQGLQRAGFQIGLMERLVVVGFMGITFASMCK